MGLMRGLPLCLLLAVAMAQEGQAGTLIGTVSVPRDFVSRQAFSAPGFWQYPNSVLEVLPALDDVRQSMVIVLKPFERRKAGGRNHVKPQLTIFDGRFSPSVLPIVPGTTVIFENRESTLHLLEAKGHFHAKRLGPAARYRHRFSNAGVFSIRCSEVPHVIATVYVGDGHMTLPDRAGEFRFDEIEPGRYTLRVWRQGAWLHKQPINVGARRTTIQVPLAGGAESEAAPEAESAAGSAGTEDS